MVMTPECLMMMYLVTMIHSAPEFWISDTCSTIAASLPRARPCPSALVTTVLPSLITTRLAFFSSPLIRKIAIYLFLLFC